ncbi:MAG TPA: TatD family hydrolase [Acidimicrobiales bacterium]|nr:TatD family hydrolase [Acidimicrobiales bacterium]
MSGWFDSHCHVQEEFLRAEGAEPGSGVAEVLARAGAAGVDGIVCVGTGPATSAQAVEVAHRAAASGGPRAWASIGLHPHEASEGTGAVEAMLAERVAAGDGAVVAVGECGLDYFYEHSPRAAQREAFAAQIALAHRYGLTLIIHARDAWDDLFDVLDAERIPERTILHCFTGGPDEVTRCLRAGMYISFSGIITFKSASQVRAAAALCPFDRLLIETDSPFLAPVPHRGRSNEPALLSHVGAAVADAKDCTVEEIRDRSAAAAISAFSLTL